MVKPLPDAFGGVAGMPVTLTVISVGWLPVLATTTAAESKCSCW
jgi:hypothetical protein